MSEMYVPAFSEILAIYDLCIATTSFGALRHYLYLKYITFVPACSSGVRPKPLHIGKLTEPVAVSLQTCVTVKQGCRSVDQAKPYPSGSLSASAARLRE